MQSIKNNLNLLQAFVILKNRSEHNYLVGGCVRDILLNRVPKDYDIVTDIPYDQIVEDFEKNDWKVQTAGKNFLVCVVSKNNQTYEVANFRKDGVYLDGRRPDSVEIGTIQEDSLRRDFTINALYLNPFTEKIEDPTNLGLKDLRSRTLRFIGNPKDRLSEDKLRIFRFYRFIQKGFIPISGHLRHVREVFNEYLSDITPERIREEVEKMCL